MKLTETWKRKFYPVAGTGSVGGKKGCGKVVELATQKYSTCQMATADRPTEEIPIVTHGNDIAADPIVGPHWLARLIEISQ